MNESELRREFNALAAMTLFMQELHDNMDVINHLPPAEIDDYMQQANSRSVQANLQGMRAPMILVHADVLREGYVPEAKEQFREVNDSMIWCLKGNDNILGYNMQRFGADFAKAALPAPAEHDTQALKATAQKYGLNNVLKLL